MRLTPRESLFIGLVVLLFALFLDTCAKAAEPVSQREWLQAMSSAGSNSVVTLHGWHPGGRVQDELRTIKQETAQVRILGRCSSACVMWSTYDNVCTSRSAVWETHYAMISIGGAPQRSRSGTKTLMDNTTRTLHAAIQAAFTINNPDNPTTHVSGALLIDRGEVEECP